MDPFFIEIAKQVPSLGVLAIIVWLFLKNTSESRTEMLEGLKTMEAEYLRTLKEIQAENIDARTLSREAIRDNTSALTKLSECINSRAS